MTENTPKTSHGGRRTGAGRPQQHTERRVTISVYVPESTAARLKSHALSTGQTVSEIVSRILEGMAEYLPEAPGDDLTSDIGSGPHESRTGAMMPFCGGYDPATGEFR